jgi:hypothetical protein
MPGDFRQFSKPILSAIGALALFGYFGGKSAQ